MEFRRIRFGAVTLLGLAWLGGTTLLGAGCNRKGTEATGSKAGGGAGVAAPPASVKAEIEDEEKLLGERGDLSMSRKRISERREELLGERQRVQSDPNALARLQSEDQKLLAEEQDLNKRERELLKRLEDLSKRVEEKRGGGPVASDDIGAGMARREALLARREADLARREGELSKRERDLIATRAKALDDCRAQAPVQTITRVEVPTRAAGYSRRDVDPLVREAQSQMRKRGILDSDLPAGGARLLSEAMRAGHTGDFAKAKYAAEQLLDVVRNVRIDRSFIGAKIDRLSAQMRGKALSAGVRGEVDRLFRQATARYGDGQFGASNSELNRIYSMLR
jgi:hypothetical protein